MSKNEFKLSKSLYTVVNVMSDEQLGKLFRLIYKFQCGLDVEVPNELTPIWALFYEKMSEDIEKSRRLSAINSANARKGGGNPAFKKGSSNPYYDKRDINEDKREINEDKRAYIDSIILDKQSLIEDKPPFIIQDTEEDKQKINEDKRTLMIRKDKGSIDKDIYINNNISNTLPYEDIKNMWNDKCPSLPNIMSLSDKRKTKIKARWIEMLKVGEPMQVYGKVLELVEASDFLKGNSATRWRASFDWVFENSSNWLKVYEGNYNNRPTRQVITKQSNDANSEW